MTSDDRRDTQSDKPTFGQLLDWIEGRLTREAAARFEQQSTFDEETQASIAWIKGFRRFGRSHPIPAPPPIVKQRLMQAFERHHGRDQPVVLQTANLMFDSRDDVVMAGVRGFEEIDEGYQLTFTTETHGVLIDVFATGESTRRIEGQVLGVEGEDSVWVVTVDHAGRSITDIHGDTNGSFSLDDVPTTVDTLQLSNGRTTINVPQPLGRSAE
ncbi:MAG: hypothetical protein OEW83_14595 [Acidimicrobiia bacterium]|nr:hypothetical protein [Acidimicrobiia bacterium]